MRPLARASGSRGSVLSPKSCREKAAELRRLSEKFHDSTTRRQLIAMAVDYERLAITVDEIERFWSTKSARIVVKRVRYECRVQPCACGCRVPGPLVWRGTHAPRRGEWGRNRPEAVQPPSSRARWAL